MSSVLHIDRQDLKLVKKIGVGGFGTVYHMIWKNTSGDVCDVAAKKLLEVDDHELQVLSTLNHPNIVKLIGVVSEEIDLMLILELCEGGSLGSYLKKHKDTKPLPHPLFRDWSQQAAKAIGYLQEMKIVHKDIKSENFLITQDNVLKLADFGLAKKTGVTVSKATERGTAAYMAPELFTEGRLSPTFDIFAYGVVLWELVTMEIPFEGKEYHYIVYHVCNEKTRLPIPDDCPDHLTDLIRRCWMEDRHKRPTIKEILSVLSKDECLPITTSVSCLTLKESNVATPAKTHPKTPIQDLTRMMHVEKSKDGAAHPTSDTHMILKNAEIMASTKPKTTRPNATVPDVDPVKHVEPKKQFKQSDFRQRDNNIKTWKYERKFGDYRAYVGIAECPNGDVAVACLKPVRCIAVYGGTNGILKCNLDTTEWLDPGQKSYPQEIAVSSDGTFFVTDDTQYVKVFTVKGKYKNRFVTRSPDTKHPSLLDTKLKGLAMDSQGHLLVGGTMGKNNYYISRHSQDGGHLGAFKVNFTPRYLAVTRHDTIIISSGSPDTSVLVVDERGQIIHTLNCPTGIKSWYTVYYGVCCGRGKIFISSEDDGNSCVICFSMSGEYLGSIEIQEVGDPSGIALTGDGTTLMVVDELQGVNVFSAK